MDKWAQRPSRKLKGDGTCVARFVEMLTLR